MNGILVINKPVGLTSHQVITKIKKILNIKKIGHAGTLDPLASGVLVVLINDATKLSDFLISEDKEYIATIAIGTSTTTEDTTGEIVGQVKVSHLDEKEVDRVLETMIGENYQIPPMFSAIKLQGQKLYELARKGETIERTPRKIMIYSLKRISPITYLDNQAYFSFRTEVSKGTYIRALCTDIGKALNYPAHMKELVRTKSGKFTLENAYDLEDIENKKFQLIPMDDALTIPKVSLTSELYSKVKNGQKIASCDINMTSDLIAFTYQNQLVAIYKKQNNYYKAERVWN